MTALFLDPLAFRPSARDGQARVANTFASGRDAAARFGTTASAAADPAGLTLHLVTDRMGFNALEADWTDLFDRAGRSCQLFQSFGWLWHWCNHFLGPADGAQSLAVVTGYRSGRLVLVLPFVKTNTKGLSHLSFMGDPVSQYGDALVEDGPHADADLAAGWKFALDATGVDGVRLRKVRADAAIAPLLRAAGAKITGTALAPAVVFEGTRTFADFEQRYPKTARKNRKRQWRRLAEQGPADIQRLSAGEAARDAVSLALSMKRGWLKDRGQVSSALCDQRTEAFFRDCASGRGPAAGVEVGLLRTNGQIAAIEVAVRCKDRIGVHLIAYNLKFEKTGAGSLLMEDSIRRACETGVGEFDLLAPGASYKFDWTDRAVEVHDFGLGLTARGKIYTALYLQRVRPVAKSAVEQMPVTLRRHLSTVLGTLLVVAG